MALAPKIEMSALSQSEIIKPLPFTNPMNDYICLPDMTLREFESLNKTGNTPLVQGGYTKVRLAEPLETLSDNIVADTGEPFIIETTPAVLNAKGVEVTPAESITLGTFV